MTKETLTTRLAERVMHWRTAPGRFLLGSRQWIPLWRFRPTERLEDAFRVLEEAAPEEYSMGTDAKNGFWVRVRMAGDTGEARGESKPLVISLAIARALHLEFPADAVNLNSARRSSPRFRSKADRV
jgi:hypothetical protein